MMSNSGASLSQPIVIPFYHLISFHLLSRLQDWLQVYNKYSTSSQYMNTYETMQQDSMDTTQQRSYYFHHQYIKSISLAVLALSTFWWWYHSFWLGSFFVDGNGVQHQPEYSFSYYRIHQTQVLETRCKTSESVISAKKKVTYLSKARSTSCVINRKYQKCEKLMYLDER